MLITAPVTVNTRTFPFPALRREGNNYGALPWILLLVPAISNLAHGHLCSPRMPQLSRKPETVSDSSSGTIRTLSSRLLAIWFPRPSLGRIQRWGYLESPYIVYFSPVAVENRHSFAFIVGMKRRASPWPCGTNGKTTLNTTHPHTETALITAPGMLLRTLLCTVPDVDLCSVSHSGHWYSSDDYSKGEKIHGVECHQSPSSSEHSSRDVSTTAAPAETETQVEISFGPDIILPLAQTSAQTNMSCPSHTVSRAPIELKAKTYAGDPITPSNLFHISGLPLHGISTLRDRENQLLSSIRRTNL